MHDCQDDNDEAGFRQTTIRSTLDKVSKRMSLYEYVYVGAALYKGTYIRASTISVPTYYKLHSRILHFRKFRLVISSTRREMFTSFKLCLHFVGRWQTVQTQIRRYITTVSDQVMSPSKRLK